MDEFLTIPMTRIDEPGGFVVFTDAKQEGERAEVALCYIKIERWKAMGSPALIDIMGAEPDQDEVLPVIVINVNVPEEDAA
jgi:hypothetical protein